MTANMHGATNAEAAASVKTPDWLNVKAYGATGNGTTDDTVAIQTAMNAAATAGNPAVVYFPAGNYVISSPLTYTAAEPLVMIGASTSGHNNLKAGASTIHMAFAPGHALAISNTPWFRLVDIDIAVDGTNSGGATADYVAIYTSGVNTVQIERCQVYKNSGNFSVNTAFRIVSSLGALIRNCSMTGEQQGIWIDGTDGCTVEDTFITTTVGNGFGAVRMDNTLGTKVATLQMSNVVTFRGDWGLYIDGTGNTAPFIYLNNIQINNPRKGGIYLQAGSQFWGHYVWISMTATPAGFNTTGIHLDTGYQGWFYLYNSVIQSPSNHGIYIGAGQGFVLNGVSFGVCGSATANTWDDLHIAAGVSNVTVTSCHFDSDKYNGIDTAAPARSAVYVEAGATGVAVTDNLIGTGYGTQPVVNNAASGSVRFRGNLGYNPVGALTAPAIPATGTALVNTTGVDASVFVSGGTVSAIAVNGVTTGLTTGQFFVPAGGTITLTYSAAPTWIWIGN